MSDPFPFILPFIIPLQPVPSQELEVTLSNQACKLKVYTKHIQVPIQTPMGGPIRRVSHTDRSGDPDTSQDGDYYTVTNPPVFGEIDPIFLDLYVNDVLVVGGVLCLNKVGIVRNTYLGFIGDLSFSDLQGNEDPRIEGLGLRWILNYWSDLP